MSQAQFLTIFQQMLVLILELSTPVLLVSLVVGLMISIFQSVTQIQEATLTFVPKIIASIIALIVLMPWMLDVFTASVHQIFEQIASF